MDSLIDLNTAAENFVRGGDAESLKRCVEYSLQPERILQLIYEEKRYECLPTVAPLFTLLFKLDHQHPLCVSILLDLFDRSEYSVLASFPGDLHLDVKFFTDQALERKIVLDFDVSPFFTAVYEAYYYETILKKDCLELFLPLEENIKSA